MIEKVNKKIDMYINNFGKRFSNWTKNNKNKKYVSSQ